MPNISGSKLADQLLQVRPDIPIILCTGHSDAINEIKAQKIGIKEYTMKPVSRNDIAKLIRKVLDSSWEVQLYHISHIYEQDVSCIAWLSEEINP